MQFPALLRSWLLVVYFDIKFGTVRVGDLGLDLNFLNVAHYVDDPLVNMAKFAVGQWSLVGLFHILEYQLLPCRFVNGQAGIALQSADLLSRFGPVIEQVHQMQVQLIDLLSPVGNIHSPSDFQGQKVSQYYLGTISL